jgi:hypothetical protein
MPSLPCATLVDMDISRVLEILDRVLASYVQGLGIFLMKRCWVSPSLLKL